MNKKRGQLAIVGVVVGIIVAVILTFSALLPVFNSVAVTGLSNASGGGNGSNYAGVYQVTQTVPMFILLGLLLTIVGGLLVLRK